MRVRDMTRDMTDIASVLRVHARGPWAGGDGPAARRPLRLPPRPLLRSPCCLSLRTTAAAVCMPTLMKMMIRSSRMKVPTLTGVLRVDSRWAPRARTRRATPASMCTGCADACENRAIHVVSCGYVARCAALGEVRGRTLKGVRQRIKIVPVDQRVMHLVVEVSRNAFGNACRRTRSKHLRVESGSNALQGSVSTMRTWHGQHAGDGLRTVGRLPPAANAVQESL